ncbi:MAG: 50S ribosomal protein L15 [Candidatus Pacebacteria bacterium CG10_big_fil_rev_8_21_14_0_10_42_12]|nr:50S ribosomal protein L15 [Candidatus Paceibacterota bacterium]PIR62945.1 MAG: 50S ribosomal protein L15 [Candidatus Pacebacteria bacterium CG10_big_fil_rev_8_21_14_0_10_42_12]
MSIVSKLFPIIARRKKRVGRGYGSGKGGHTSGRGTKGQKSRSGGKVPLWFEGGQLALIKRMPMLRGKSRLKSFDRVAMVTLTELNRMKATDISFETLKLEGVVGRSARAAKVVNTGKIERKINLISIKTTASARQQVEAAGGSVVTTTE